MVERGRWQNALEQARQVLLAERGLARHWVGELATSALSTATATSALAMILKHGGAAGEEGAANERDRGQLFQSLIAGGLTWLAEHQNSDGGWGDTDLSPSNIATTMLALAAFHLGGLEPARASVVERAALYVQENGGAEGLRKRYGVDKTFAAPILANCAMAGISPWSEVAVLPFELACLPQAWYRFARLPVVSYAIPALVAVGQAKYFHSPPWNPLVRWVRRRATAPSLEVLRRTLPESGGYLEATPLTSFVVMSLASVGQARHEVAVRGTRFLIDSVRSDGGWPIDTNLATWNTTLAIQALANGGFDVGTLGVLPWLLSCQHRQIHPATGAAPGGWAWTDLSGGVHDADDTPGALLALDAIRRSASCSEAERRQIGEAMAAGVEWLLGMQNGNGGWPTFCRGWGVLPFDRSGSDLTAHALRALRVGCNEESSHPTSAAMERGFAYLRRTQQGNGSWLPLWFGNHSEADEANPVYGTAKVLLAYRDCGRQTSAECLRGATWLMGRQNPDGGWGGERERRDQNVVSSSVEETALAVETLLDLAPRDPEAIERVRRGVEWLVGAVEQDFYRKPFPIGFYFARLWYYERLYPLTFTVSALGKAQGWPGS